jgi:exopolyphosphatase/guanosine-5'-triphosphate,3'-diphosphate pyrophosphatase
MQGFPREEQQLLAAVVGAHRRKLVLDDVDDLLPPWHLKAEYLIVLLRLAVLLHRGRSPRAVPDVELQVKGRAIELRFPKGWLAEHPLTAADLEQEVEYLRAGEFRLRTN